MGLAGSVRENGNQARHSHGPPSSCGVIIWSRSAPVSTIMCISMSYRLRSAVWVVGRGQVESAVLPTSFEKEKKRERRGMYIDPISVSEVGDSSIYEKSRTLGTRYHRLSKSPCSAKIIRYCQLDLLAYHPLPIYPMINVELRRLGCRVLP